MILRMATEKDLELLTELRMAYILAAGCFRKRKRENSRKRSELF